MLDRQFSDDRLAALYDIFFETRNPLLRAWERWPTKVEVTDATGAVVRREHEWEMEGQGDVVRFITTFTSPAWDHPEVSVGKLRFVDVDTLRSLLSGSGLVIEEQFGDWAHGSLNDTSPEIITIAMSRSISPLCE